jgi:hypothetical protein
MNDEDEINEITITTIPGQNIGDIWFDSNQASYVINTGAGNSVVTSSYVNSNITFTEPNALEINAGKIKIGELIMEVEQFETCLRHLLEITKREKPEEFI